MPGPRLQGRTSNPRAIAPNIINTTAGLAQLANAGVTAFQIHKDTEQQAAQIERAKVKANTLVQLRDDISKVKEAARQSSTTPTQTATHLENLALTYQKANPMYADDISKILNDAGPGSASVQIEKESYLHQRSRQEKQIDDFKQQVEENNIDPTLPLVAQVAELQQINFEKNQIAEQTRANEMIKELGLTNKDTSLRLANSMGSFMSGTLGKLWDAELTPSTELFQSYTPEQKTEASSFINQTYNEAIKGIYDNAGFSDLSKDELDRSLLGLTQKKEALLALIKDPTLKDMYDYQTNLSKSTAVFNRYGSVKDQDNLLQLQKLSELGNYPVLLKMLSQSKGKVDIAELVSQGLLFATRDNPSNAGFEGFAVNNRALNEYAGLVTGVFSDILSSQGEKYTPQDAVNGFNEINVILGVQESTIQNPTMYSPKTWDAFLMVGASKQGVVLAKNPALSRAKDNFMIQLQDVDSSLILAGKDIYIKNNALPFLDTSSGHIQYPSDPKYAQRLNLYIESVANMEGKKYEEVLEAWKVENAAYFQGSIAPEDLEKEEEFIKAAKLAIDKASG